MRDMSADTEGARHTPGPLHALVVVSQGVTRAIFSVFVVGDAPLSGVE